jgi:hypothetical protein
MFQKLKMCQSSVIGKLGIIITFMSFNQNFSRNNYRIYWDTVVLSEYLHTNRCSSVHTISLISESFPVTVLKLGNQVRTYLRSQCYCTTSLQNSNQIMQLKIAEIQIIQPTSHLRVVPSTASCMTQSRISPCFHCTVAELLCNSQNVFVVWDSLRKVTSVMMWWSQVAVCPSLLHLQHYHNIVFMQSHD